MFGAMDAELIIFVGLQASGKSTFFRGRFAATHEHVSKDLFRNIRSNQPDFDFRLEVGPVLVDLG